MSSKKTRIHVPTPEEIEALHLPSSGESPGKADGDARTAKETAEAASPASGAEELERLRAECESWRNRAARAVADYQNLQRRSENERAATARYALADFVKSLLPIIDDLERTLGAAGESKDVQSLRDGVQLIHDNLIKLLEGNRVERIAADGQPFDPACHEAMMAEPRDDVPDKTVIRELARGYRLVDRVLRPSKVVISQAPSGAETTADAGESSPEPAAGGE
jgi:molecular chaperone GrpE